MSLSIASIASLLRSQKKFNLRGRSLHNSQSVLADNTQHYIDDEGMEDKLIMQVCGAHPKLKNMCLLYKQSEMAEQATRFSVSMRVLRPSFCHFWANGGSAK